MRQAASAQTEIPTISQQPPRSGVPGRAKKTGAHARAKVLVTATERESTRGGAALQPDDRTVRGPGGRFRIDQDGSSARPRPPSPRRRRTRRQTKKTGDERPC